MNQKRKPDTPADLESLDSVLAKHNPPEELLALRVETRELRNRVKQYKREHGQIESLITQVLTAIPQAAPLPQKIVARSAATKSATPCDVGLNLTDIHYGAVQEPDEVEGFGEYDPDICKSRIRHLVEDVLAWVKIKRGGYYIPRIHVLMTGDYVSGDIHDELRVTNAFPAPVQAVGVGELLSETLLTLAEHFEQVCAHIVTVDNHGRLTRKPQAKEGGLNNWGYVVARWIEQQCENVKQINVNTIPRPWDSVDCNGRRYLLTHGHTVMGWAGFPYYGIERLVSREALKRMNAAEIRKFHRVIMGHWHAPLEHPWYWIGGSVSGTDAFDHGQGRYSDPKQVAWMIHPTHGEFDRTAFLLHG